MDHISDPLIAPHVRGGLPQCDVSHKRDGLLIDILFKSAYAQICSKLTASGDLLIKSQPSLTA